MLRVLSAGISRGHQADLLVIALFVDFLPVSSCSFDAAADSCGRRALRLATKQHCCEPSAVLLPPLPSQLRTSWYDRIVCNCRERASATSTLPAGCCTMYHSAAAIAK